VKSLITGAAGFMGPFLRDHCLEAGSSVLGIDICEPSEPWADAAFERCDVRDYDHFSKVISQFGPDRIFHLAAQSYPTVSLEKPRETVESNLCGTINLYEALRSFGMKLMVVVACSSAEYGPVSAEDVPVKETHHLRPLHPYGVSKVGQDLIASQYFINYSIPTVRIRIFNTTGPGKIGDVCSDLTRRAVELELGIQKRFLKVGNLTSRRAIGDVRDLIRALWISADRCELGEVYNVGAEYIYSVQEVIDAIRAQVNVRFEIQQDRALMRPSDEPVIAGDTSKFRSRCNWKPEISLTTTLRAMLEWWRSRLSNPVASSVHKYGMPQPSPLMEPR
jgi:GDP-4-dehydro-6-deoxy-D-mannose reductase